MKYEISEKQLKELEERRKKYLESKNVEFEREFSNGKVKRNRQAEENRRSRDKIER